MLNQFGRIKIEGPNPKMTETDGATNGILLRQKGLKCDRIEEETLQNL